MRVELVEDVEAPPAQVWAMFVEPEALARWFGPHMALDARPGGGFREVWRDGGREVVTSGRVTAFEEGRRLALTWADADWPAETEVEIAIEPRGTGSRVRLTHGGWERLGEDGAALAAAHRDGWRHHLGNLKRFAGTG